MEKKKKVFLAFSNAADQEDLIQVKYLLNQEGVEIVQFENGNYDKEQMLDCDFIFLITPRQDIVSGQVSIGRGQYDQLMFLRERKHIGSDKKNLNEVSKALAVFCYDKNQTKKGMFLAKVKSIQTDDINDFKLKYGKIGVVEIPYSLQFSLNYVLAYNASQDIKESPANGSDNCDETGEQVNIKDWLL